MIFRIGAKSVAKRQEQGRASADERSRGPLRASRRRLPDGVLQ